MNNFERVKQSNSVEEMAKIIKAVAINHLCDRMLGGDKFDIEQWLKSKVEE